MFFFVMVAKRCSLIVNSLNNLSLLRMGSEKVCLRSCVCKFYEISIHNDNKLIGNPFLSKISLNELYTTYQNVTRKDWGPKDNSAPKLTKPKIQQLEQLFEKNDRVLLLSSATKFNFFSPCYQHRIISKKRNIKNHKKKMPYKKNQENKLLPWKQGVVACYK